MVQSNDYWPLLWRWRCFHNFPALGMEDGRRSHATFLYGKEENSMVQLRDAVLLYGRYCRCELLLANIFPDREGSEPSQEWILYFAGYFSADGACGDELGCWLVLFTCRLCLLVLIECSL